jgi:hypothetical protein
MTKKVAYCSIDSFTEVSAINPGVEELFITIIK